MRRITKNEWDLINSALAYFEADADEQASMNGQDVEKLERDIERVRGKVFERLRSLEDGQRQRAEVR